jgi:hypothetical protein
VKQIALLHAGRGGHGDAGTADMPGIEHLSFSGVYIKIIVTSGGRIAQSVRAPLL